MAYGVEESPRVNAVDGLRQGTMSENFVRIYAFLYFRRAEKRTDTYKHSDIVGRYV